MALFEKLAELAREELGLGSVPSTVARQLTRLGAISAAFSQQRVSQQTPIEGGPREDVGPTFRATQN